MHVWLCAKWKSVIVEDGKVIYFYIGILFDFYKSENDAELWVEHAWLTVFGSWVWEGFIYFCY